MTYKISMLFKALAAKYQVHNFHSIHEDILVFHSVNTDRDLSIEWPQIFQQVYSEIFTFISSLGKVDINRAK